jgi:hypothetical protein
MFLDGPKSVATSGIRRRSSSGVVGVGAVYETEGHRFESCRARWLDQAVFALLKAFLAARHDRLGRRLRPLKTA